MRAKSRIPGRLCPAARIHPTSDVDDNGETIMRLALPPA